MKAKLHSIKTVNIQQLAHVVLPKQPSHAHFSQFVHKYHSHLDSSYICSQTQQKVCNEEVGSGVESSKTVIRCKKVDADEEHFSFIFCSEKGLDSAEFSLEGSASCFAGETALALAKIVLCSRK